MSRDRMGLTALVLACVASLGLPRDGHAQLEPVGPQMVVNSYTTGSQDVPHVAFATDGTVLVGWWSDDGSELTPGRLAAQRYMRDGMPIGAELTLESGDGFSYAGPKLAPLGDGFLMLWSRITPPIYSHGDVLARRIDASGGALGTEVVLNEAPVRFLSTRTLTRGSDDRFLATWEHWDDGDLERDLDARLLDAAGVPVGTSFRVNEPSPYDQSYPDVAAAGSSGYVVVWASLHDGVTEDEFGISARRYDLSGSPIGAQFLVASSTERVEEPDVGARPDGSFVVTWTLQAPTESYEDVFARRYSSDAIPLGSVFQVNTETLGGQRYPDVEVDAQGAFHIVWVDGVENGSVSDDETEARSFTAGGTPLGGPYLLASGLRASRRPALEIAPDGVAWTVWTDGNWTGGTWNGADGDRAGVVARPAWVAGQCRDLDGDGYGAPGAADCAAGPAPDCDDGDPAVNPGAVEIPANGIDDDCDPSTPSGCNAEELGG